MDAASGFGTAGKKSITKATIRKQMAAILTGIPIQPKLNREGGNASLRSFLASKTLMHSK